MRASSMKFGLVLALSLGLAACGGDMDDLDQYINEIKARPGGRIEPLPEITPYEGFTYVADKQGLRSPFVPDTPQAAGPAAGGTRPDPDRSREYTAHHEDPPDLTTHCYSLPRESPVNIPVPADPGRQDPGKALCSGSRATRRESACDC